jgi:hypothetical protein
MEAKLNPYGRCPDCGRFVKRGLWNFIRHVQDKCPEKELIIFSIKGCKLIKLKNYNGNQKTTNHRNSRMEN